MGGRKKKEEKSYKKNTTIHQRKNFGSRLFTQKKKKKNRDTTIKKVYNLGIEFIIVPIRQPNLLKRKGKGKKTKKTRDTTINKVRKFLYKKKVCKFGIEINQHNQKVYSNKPTKFINQKKKHKSQTTKKNLSL